MLPSRLTRAAACALAAATLGALAGCGSHEGEGEVRREGLALPLGGVSYEVVLTRQVNPRDVEDMGYLRTDLQTPGAPPGRTYYGVFLQACNLTDEPQRTASTFRIVDTAGKEIEPVDLEEGNPFAYQPTLVEPSDCFPREGSLAEAGPASASLLLFEVPIEATENRPLELEILGGFSPEEGAPEKLTIELDL